MLQSAPQQVKGGSLPQGSRSILHTQMHTRDFSLDFPPVGLMSVNGTVVTFSGS